MKFINNKYTKWYYNIIESAKSNPFNGYTEKHHIIPKSLGGSNDKSNLVVLSARQHFICHWLLTKMTEGKNKWKLGYAFNRMLVSGSQKQQRYTPKSSKLFEICRIQCNNAMKGRTLPEAQKKAVGDFHRGKTISDAQKKAISEKLTGRKMTEENKQRFIDNNPSQIHGVKEKQSQARKEWWADPENMKLGKINAANRKPPSENTREKMRQSKLDLFKDMSDEDKQKLNVVKQTQFQWTCEHCGKSGKGKSNFSRWHSKCSINTI